MRKCTMCQNHDSCSEQRRRECRIRDYLFFRPTFVGRCDNCGAPLYADSVRYEATIGRQTLELACAIQSTDFEGLAALDAHSGSGLRMSFI